MLKTQIHHRVLLCLLFSLASAVAADQPAVERGESLVRQHVAVADTALQRGDLSAALESLEAADAIPLPEVPNYQLLARIAELQCREGKVELGLKTLTDFRCMLGVDAGRELCFLPAAPGQAPQRNPTLTEACFARMCGEVYLSYYENPTPETLNAIRDLEQQAVRVEALCALERRAANAGALARAKARAAPPRRR